MMPNESAPVPVPPSEVLIKLPQDQYRHAEAPTEWWWHTGTLVAGDRVFGFEINAASFAPLAFTEVMLTDVANQRHYQKTVPQTPGEWAETDPSKDWYVRLGMPEIDHDWIWMIAPQADPSNMTVKAQLQDEATGATILFDLNLVQRGPPLIVWGTGCNPTPPNDGGSVTANNYYYSFTRLQASGSIAIGGEVFEVTGQTWMDHEYGLFGSSTKPVLWYLQDMQLDNGVHISHYMTLSGSPPQAGQSYPSNATIQFPDGTTYFVQDCTMTPGARTWTAPSGQIFFLDFQIDIPDFGASIAVTTPVDDQAFLAYGAYVYEGLATASGTFDGQQVSGTAWNEQRP